MRLIPKIATLVGVTTTAVLSMFGIPVMALTLTNAPGDGSVNVGVDGFGSFGSNVRGSGTTDAIYDPVGAIGPARTTFQSGVAIGFGGARTFLTSGRIGSGPLANPTITGNSTSANSSFDFNGLNFNATQTLTPLFNRTDRSGTQLSQVYNITNTSSTPLNFELVRYFDGDLGFDGSLVDGGGRLSDRNPEILFETDTATGRSDETTFIGITGEGGTNPTTNRFEIGVYPNLRSRIVSGNALNDSVLNDSSTDSDQFVDAGRGYDITPALRNTFALDPSQTTTYTTRTIFGSGAPEDIILPPTTNVPVTPPVSTPVPFEFSPGLMILVLGAASAIAQVRSKVKNKNSLEVLSLTTNDRQA